MARKRTNSKPTRFWSKDWSLGVNVWVERQGQKFLGEPAADLLSAVDRTQSISAAARSLGISYRHAWLLLQEASQNAAEPLVATAVGGQRGGGAHLTDYGRAALDAFQRIQADVRRASIQALAKIARPAEHGAAVIHLAAAISLQEVIAQALSEYALLRPMASMRTIFGASNELADQIASGSSIDLFISASGSEIRRLAKGEFVVRGSRCKLARNGLAIVGNSSFAGKLRKPSDLRRFAAIPLIVADPACPLGKCTAKFLKAESLGKPLQSNMQVVNNSRAVVASMRAREPRIGIIFSSDARSEARLTTLLEVPIKQANTEYEGAVMESSKVSDEANAFLQFLKSEMGQRCFRRCGFSV